MNNEANRMSGIEMCDLDMDMLKCVIQSSAKEIYDATSSNSGYEIARTADETLEKIIAMIRAIELLDKLYTENTMLRVGG